MLHSSITQSQSCSRQVSSVSLLLVNEYQYFQTNSMELRPSYIEIIGTGDFPMNFLIKLNLAVFMPLLLTIWGMVDCDVYSMQKEVYI